MDLPTGESLPTPVARLPHDGDLGEEPPSARGRRRAGAARQDRPQAPRTARRRQAPVTVDLSPYLDAVPDLVVERLRGARRVLAVGHENPDADTLGATLGDRPSRRGARRERDPVSSDPARRCTTS